MVEKGTIFGGTVDCNFSFEHHIMEKVSKANKMMGLVRRSFAYVDTEKVGRFYEALRSPL